MGSSLDEMSEGYSAIVDGGFSQVGLKVSSRVFAGYLELLLTCGCASSSICHVGGYMARGLLYFLSYRFLTHFGGVDPV